MKVNPKGLSRRKNTSEVLRQTGKEDSVALMYLA